MIYVIKKSNWMLQGMYSDLKLVKDRFARLHLNENDYFITQDFDMNYISRVVYVDGVCVYNNKKFWSETVCREQIIDNYEQHTVLDFMGLPVDKERFITEFNTNITRLNTIDGTAGEIEYNMVVGDELIALLREECIKTELHNVTPLQIAAKTAQIIPMLQTGSFREANQLISTLETDEFFTRERLDKYSSMIAAADVITYAK